MPLTAFGLSGIPPPMQNETPSTPQNETPSTPQNEKPPTPQNEKGGHSTFSVPPGAFLLASRRESRSFKVFRNSLGELAIKVQ